jgi:hypothetical protein
VTTAALRAPRLGQSIERKYSQMTDCETLGQQHFLSASLQMMREKAERPLLLVAQLGHCTLSVSPQGPLSSVQLDIGTDAATALIGPTVRATTPSGRSVLSTAWWRQFQRETKSDCTPSSRTLPSAIASIG